MYDRILLPTDGSEASSRAVTQAIELATETGAELHVLFVVEDLPYAPELMDDDAERQLRQVGEDALEEIRERTENAEIDVVTTVRQGVPHNSILEYADDNGTDVIVMGTHGRSGLDRYLLGSVAERVVRTATVPVLTVRKADVEQ